MWNKSIKMRHKLLPNIYQAVEYIKSSGTQYIDTGLVAGNNTSIELKLSLEKENPNNNWSKICGSEGNIFIQTNKTNDTPAFYHRFSTANGSNNDPYRAIASSQYVYGQVCTVKWFNGGIVFNGATTSCSTNTIAGTSNLFLWRSSPTSSTQNSYFSLYWCKIYDGNNVIAHFVPCYRKSDNVIGLYDVVRRKFYTNAGTGTFTKGGNIYV